MQVAEKHNWLIALLGHWKWFFSHVFIPVWQAKIRYWLVMKRLRCKYGHEKLKVLFVTGTPAKWKCQSLYDLMARSKKFAPYICQTICDIECTAENQQMRVAHLDKCREYYTSLGNEYLEAYSRDAEDWLDLNRLQADIVFYNQPWGVAKCQMPFYVAKTALTFQIPYYVANYGDLDVDIRQPFQRTLFRYCSLNRDWTNVLKKGVSRFLFAGKILSTGHTALDWYHLNLGRYSSKEYVIYAPHWSIDCPENENFENYSTFLKSGKQILDFARRHQKVKWVFRPHPTLRKVLEQTGVWSKDEVREYYEAWSTIGVFSEGAGYETLFMESRVMITDCGSFLTEYACTGNPIIHLISSTAKLKPMKPSADLYATYYQVHNDQELDEALDTVVLKTLDPKREKRLVKVREAGLLDNYAAQNIMDELKKLLGGN